MCMKIDWKLTGEYRSETTPNNMTHEIEYWKFVEVHNEKITSPHQGYEYKPGLLSAEHGPVTLDQTHIYGGAFHAYLTKKDAQIAWPAYDDHYCRLLRVTAKRSSVLALGKEVHVRRVKGADVEESATTVCLTQIHISEDDFKHALSVPHGKKVSRAQRTSPSKRKKKPYRKILPAAGKPSPKLRRALQRAKKSK